MNLEHDIHIEYCCEKQPILNNIELYIYQAIQKTLELEGFTEQAEVSVIVVDRAKIKALNQLYRAVDRETDVLSFTQYDEEGFIANQQEKVLLGDIALCYDIAVAQAEQYGHSIIREVSYLICHATLHLLGYDHMTRQDKASMRRREEDVMQLLDLVIQ